MAPAVVQKETVQNGSAAQKNGTSVQQKVEAVEAVEAAKDSSPSTTSQTKTVTTTTTTKTSTSSAPPAIIETSVTTAPKAITTTPYRKSTSLRESTSGLAMKYVSQLDAFGKDIFEDFETIEDVLGLIGMDRLRYMPHDGSVLDRVFKWAVHFVLHIHDLSMAVDPFALNAEETAKLAWGSCLLLLQVS